MIILNSKRSPYPLTPKSEKLLHAISMKNNKPNSSWQDINIPILSKIFTFLTFHDQLFGPPYVCHSWLSATLDTLFQNSNLHLRLIDDLHDENQRSRYTHLLRLAITQYRGWVSICFPSKHMLDYHAAMYVAEKTPNITSCVFSPSDDSVCIFPVYMSLPYWKNLRAFRARIRPALGFLVLSQLVDHSKNLVELGFHGEVMEKEVLCIVEGLPELKVLDISESTVSCDALAIVLDGRLKCIKELNVLHCLFVGDDGNDIRRKDYAKLKGFKKEMVEKVRGLGSLKKFMHCLGITCRQCKGSSLENR